MIFPFLAASAVAAAFFQLGSMSMRIALLTGALQVACVFAVAFALAAIYALYAPRKV